MQNFYDFFSDKAEEDNVSLYEQKTDDTEISQPISPRRKLRLELRRRIDARIGSRENQPHEAEASVESNESDTESEDETTTITTTGVTSNDSIVPPLPPSLEEEMNMNAQGYAFPSDNTLMEALREDSGDQLTTAAVNADVVSMDISAFPSDNTLRAALTDETGNHDLPEMHFADSFVDDGKYYAMQVKYIN